MGKSNCYHCGDECGSEAVVYEAKDFCCNGCQLVYSLLKENELDGFYSLKENPRLSLKDAKEGSAFDYLDDETVSQKLLDFCEGNTARLTLKIPQIHCHSCIWLLEKLDRLDEHISSSRVNFLKKELTISYNPNERKLSEVIRLLASLGYEPSISLSDGDEKPREHGIEKKEWFRLGLTFFCFGNIMLLSFPEYVSKGFSIEGTLSGTFGYLSLALSLPILFYGGIDYLRSAFIALKNRGINIDVPISLGIICLFTVSTYEILTGTGAGYLDSLAGLIFFLLLGKIFQRKTFHRLSFERDYKAYFPLSVTTVSNGKAQSIPLAKLEVGQRVLVRNSELIPADALLIKGQADIDYSFVTGESDPVHKELGELLYAGGRQHGGAIEIEIQKPPSQSYLTSLWNDQAFDKERENGLDRISNAVSKWFTLVVIAIAISAFGYWTYQGKTEVGLHAFTSVLIIACPCALALAIPFTMGNILRIFGKHKFYLKDIGVIEQLSRISSIVFDKTGTLTNAQKASVHFEGEALSEEEKLLVKSLLEQSGHPLSRLVSEQLSVDGKIIPVDNFQELTGKGIEGLVDGQNLRIGKASFVDKGLKSHTNETTVHLAINGIYRGHFTVSNHYRQGISEALEQLGHSYTLSLLSGDGDAEKPRLEALMGQQADLHFSQSPHDKLQKIREKKASGEATMMLGDGLNDAGALKESNVGVAVSDNVAHFTPASDAILEASQLPKLEHFLKFSHLGVKLVYVSFGLSFLYNLVGLFFAVRGDLSPVVSAILMPLSSISVALFAMLSTNLLGNQWLPSTTEKGNARR